MTIALNFAAHVMTLEDGQCVCGSRYQISEPMHLQIEVDGQPVTRHLLICGECQPWVDLVLAEMDAEAGGVVRLALRPVEEGPR